MERFPPRQLLEQRGLRVTRPREAVAELLLGDGADRHVTAEWVADQLGAAGLDVALATVYNTLRAFVEAGLLREVKSGGACVMFDTNTARHHHIYNERTGALTDVEFSAVSLSADSRLPEGVNPQDVELLIRVR